MKKNVTYWNETVLYGKKYNFYFFFVILETLLSVSYISNCMVVMYQSTFFFFFFFTSTSEHTSAHTWRVTQHSWDCTFVFLESRSCLHTLTITINTRTILCYWYAVCLMRYFHVWTVWNLLKTAVTECLRFSWTQWVILRRF